MSNRNGSFDSRRRPRLSEADTFRSLTEKTAERIPIGRLGARTPAKGCGWGGSVFSQTEKSKAWPSTTIWRNDLSGCLTAQPCSVAPLRTASRVFGSGFATKGEALDAEATRRFEEQQKRNLTKAGVSVTAETPKTLSTLLEEFFRQHVVEKLAPKTIERYHEQAAYIDPALLAMALSDITPLHLSRE